MSNRAHLRSTAPPVAFAMVGVMSRYAHHGSFYAFSTATCADSIAGNSFSVVTNAYTAVTYSFRVSHYANAVAHHAILTAIYSHATARHSFVIAPYTQPAAGNRSQFQFSALGLLQRTAVMGKAGGTDEGDDIDTAPGTRLEYDFLAYHNAQQPVWVKTIKREYHIHDGDIPAGADPNATIATVEYTDGFGRLLQTRTQAEDVLFGDGLFGDSGLPAEQGTNANAVGVQRPASALHNVVVSGWQVYNNKGKVVEQYEPYFDRGFQYTAPFNNATLQSAIQGGVMVQMYYDPRGQVVRTVNPDATEQWVLFGTPANITGVSLNSIGIPSMYDSTPWESYAFDANDLAPRTHSQNSGVPATHHWTPSSSLLDPLGRTVRTIDRNGSQAADEVVMRYEYDIRGNLLTVTDALGRLAFTHVYDLKPKSGEGEEEKGANILKTTHIDSGTKTALFEALFKPIELKDAKGAHILHAYDTLNRPTRIWAKDKTGEDSTLRQKLIYGDDAVDGPANPTDTNHLGQLYEHYDEAGLLTISTYDLKGNVLQKKREVISDAEILSVFDGPPADWAVPTYRVDWDSTPAMEGGYVSDMEYDALNRLKKLTYPEDVESERKELVPTYNRAGALEKVSLDGNTYVEHIAYNAKGQRLLIAFGNDVMTRYAYDSKTFRLTRQRSETYTQSGHTFTPNGTVHQDTGYDYDLSGNILRIKERGTNCGVGGSSSIDRVFNYDPLYRLLSATGRENSPTITPIWDDSYRSTDHSITTAYTQNYQYDSMGNIQQLKHTGTNNFTRNFSYNSTHNKLQGITIGGDTYSFQYDANGNQIQENTDRHFEWDFADKLRSFRVQAGTSQPTKFAHYLYDAGGNRVKKLVRVSGGNHTSTTYIDGIFEKLTDGSDTQNTLHVLDDKSHIASIRLGDAFGDTTPAVKYVLENHIGSSTAEIDDNGTSVEKEEYYPFGETSFASYAKKRFKYCGKERDNESGLYYYGARYYSAWTGRFISTDPMARKFPFYSSYNYAGNKPIVANDLDGKQENNEVEPKSDKIDVDVNSVYVGIALNTTIQLPIVPGGSISIEARFLLTYDVKSKGVFAHAEFYASPGVGKSVSMGVVVGASTASVLDTKKSVSNPLFDSLNDTFGNKFNPDFEATKKSASGNSSKQGVGAAKGFSFGGGSGPGIGGSIDFDWGALATAFIDYLFTLEEDLKAGETQNLVDNITQLGIDLVNSIEGAELWIGEAYGVSGDAPAIFQWIPADPVKIYDMNKVFRPDVDQAPLELRDPDKHKNKG